MLPNDKAACLAERIFLRMCELVGVELDTLGAFLTWEDVKTAVVDEGDITVLDLVCLELGRSRESICWALTCLHKTMEMGAFVLPATDQVTAYTAASLPFVAMQLLQSFSLPDGEGGRETRFECEEADAVALEAVELLEQRENSSLTYIGRCLY